MIVRNEEQALPGCLRCLEGVVDELVVLDTGSTDRTPEILAETSAGGRFARVRWQRHRFAGFGSARQVSLDLVETEWALCIDPDETLSEALRRRLKDLLASGEIEKHNGWHLNRVNRVFDREMTGCRLRDQHVLRLFRTGQVRLTDSAVHEGFILADGSTTGLLTEPMYHDAMTSWREYLKKVDQYTSLEVAASNRPFNPLHLIVTGPQVMLKQYVLRGGYRDGWPGFVWSLTSAWSVTLRDIKRLKKALARVFPERP